MSHILLCLVTLKCLEDYNTYKYVKSNNNKQGDNSRREERVRLNIFICITHINFEKKLQYQKHFLTLRNCQDFTIYSSFEI